MTTAAIIYAVAYAFLMLAASATIDTPNKGRAIFLAGLNVLAIFYMLVQT